MEDTYKEAKKKEDRKESPEVRAVLDKIALELVANLNRNVLGARKETKTQ